MLGLSSPNTGDAAPFCGRFPPQIGAASTGKTREAGKIDGKKTLQELCRERKEALHLTYADIAERSGIVEKTVKNFFGDSKQPSIHTAGPICRALGVSLNGYFDIVVEADEPSQLELAQQKNEHLIEIGELKDDRIERGDKSNLKKDRIIVAMAGFVLFLVAYMTIVDLFDPMIGLFRGSVSASGVVALLGFGVAAVYVCILAVGEIRDRRREK